MKNSVVAERIADLLATTPAFDRLPQEDREQLMGRVSMRYYGPEEVILEQGTTRHEYLYIIESGSVRLTEKESGRLVDEYGERDIFGNYGLMNGGQLPFEVRATEPTVCVLLGEKDFRKLYENHGGFAAFFDKELRSHEHDGGSGLDASGSRLLFGTTLGELVGRGPVVCTPQSTAREVAQAMRDENADSVVVTDGDEVLGILSDIDLRNKIVADGVPAETAVEDLMHRNALRLDAGGTGLPGSHGHDAAADVPRHRLQRAGRKIRATRGDIRQRHLARPEQQPGLYNRTRRAHQRPRRPL